MNVAQKITTNLWFNKNAEQAVAFYTSVFKNSQIKRITHYGKEGYEIHHMPEGMVMTLEFEIDGRTFVALNGGDIFKFTEAISFIINCFTQEEIDYYWHLLGEKGDPEAQQCGWLKDKFGISWQVVPVRLMEMITSGDPVKTGKVMSAMLAMKKLNIAELEIAFNS